jgi:hypothetical protein
MKFVARKVDGQWRLAVCRGRVITTDYRLGHNDPIVFTNQATAKACADHLNTFFAGEYAKYLERDNTLKKPTVAVPDTLIERMGKNLNMFLRMEL